MERKRAEKREDAEEDRGQDGEKWVNNDNALYQKTLVLAVLTYLHWCPFSRTDFKLLLLTYNAPSDIKDVLTPY